MNCQPMLKAFLLSPTQCHRKRGQTSLKKGIQNVWMQPGAESDAAIKFCEDNHINVIGGGPCILVAMGFKEV